MLNEFPHAASKNKQFFQSGIHQHSKLNEAAILAKKISISPVKGKCDKSEWWFKTILTPYGRINMMACIAKNM